MQNNLFQFSNSRSISLFHGMGFITSTMNNTVQLNQINGQNAVKLRRRIKVQHKKSALMMVIKLAEEGNLKMLEFYLWMYGRDTTAYILTAMYTGMDHLFRDEIEDFGKRYEHLKRYSHEHLIDSIKEKMPSLATYLKAAMEVLP